MCVAHVQCSKGANTEAPKGLRERNMSLNIVSEIISSDSDESQKLIFWWRENADFNGSTEDLHPRRKDQLVFVLLKPVKTRKK